MKKSEYYPDWQFVWETEYILIYNLVSYEYYNLDLDDLKSFIENNHSSVPYLVEWLVNNWPGLLQ
jgi:hypothetical protein